MTDADKLEELEKVLNDCNLYFKKFKRQKRINRICFAVAFIIGVAIGWVIL